MNKALFGTKDVPKKKTRFYKKKWFKRTVIALILLAVILAAAFLLPKKKGGETEELTTAVVTRGTIENKVTGSGTVEAKDTYNIVPTVNGEIVYCEAEEGDYVEEGQVLYRFDTETSDNAIKTAENRVKTAQNSVETARLSLEQTKENVSKLTVTAPSKGVVSGLTAAAGDNVQGVVCTITDNSYMEAKIPVSASSSSKINVGDSVTAGLDRYMKTVPGSVTSISQGSFAGSNGAMVKYVEIRIDNPGSIAEKTMATATFHTSSGDIESAGAAELSYPSAAKANAEQSGTVAKINVKNGDFVNKGDVIMTLSNTQLSNSLKSAQISYENAMTNYNDAQTALTDAKKQAEDYILTAPISGKVLSKSYKKGDTVYGQNSTTLMVVADTSQMKFTLNVDELDVAKISVGQTVDITAEAIEGKTFTGEITTVSLMGTASSGVTYYPVEITIAEPGELLPGMNVDAEIVVERAENVLMVPVGAVSYFDGKRYVTVVGETEMPDNQGSGERPHDMEGMERPTGGEMPTEENGEKKGFRQGRMPDASENIKMNSEQKRTEVTVGISNDDYIEIVSGLSEGQVVITTESSSDRNAMGGMPMGGMGGGMPMGGGAPGGGPR